MKQLTVAIIAVMKAVKGIEKNSNVGEGTRSSYKGVKDQDVKQEYSKAMADNGLCILPISVEDDVKINRWTDTYGKSKQQVFCAVKTKYLLMHTSGECMEIAGYGHGVDSQDKAAGKATTYAMKYALLYSFMTPTGDIDDSDETHSKNIEVPDNRKTVSDENLAALISHAKEKGWTIQVIEKNRILTPPQKGKIVKALKASK